MMKLRNIDTITIDSAGNNLDNTTAYILNTTTSAYHMR